DMARKICVSVIVSLVGRGCPWPLIFQLTEHNRRPVSGPHPSSLGGNNVERMLMFPVVILIVIFAFDHLAPALEPVFKSYPVKSDRLKVFGSADGVIVVRVTYENQPCEKD